MAAPVTGLLNIDKPVGWTSMDVVRKVRRCAGGVKTGHAGTLDPLAEGVLLCCLGPATRWVSSLMELTKVYVARVDLSAFTATDDAEGDPQKVAVGVPPEADQIRDVLKGFEGVHQQVPPAFSAVHVDGQKAYLRARRGETVSLTARPVRIDSIELITYQWPIAQIKIVCGKGTYIRSIARDLGQHLGTGGHLVALERTRIGPFERCMSIPVDGLCKLAVTQRSIDPAELTHIIANGNVKAS